MTSIDMEVSVVGVWHLCLQKQTGKDLLNAYFCKVVMFSVMDMKSTWYKHKPLWEVFWQNSFDMMFIFHIKILQFSRKYR